MNTNIHKIIRFSVATVLIAALSLGGGILGSRITQNNTPTETVFQDSVQPASVTTLPSGDSDAVARAFQEKFRDIAATTLPEVVEVNVTSTVTQPAFSSPFDFFFGKPGGKPQEREYQQRGLGSGVIVAKKGDTVYVLTNNHVAGEADKIDVVLSDKRNFTAELVGADSMMDLALISFTAKEDIPVAVLGDSDSLAEGDWVFAVGNPLGFQSTITAGIVSATYRDAQPGSGMSGITSYIQTDAAINQGNSGGALVNLDGEVIGINTWIASQNGGNIGLGFAIPINDAKRAIMDFIDTGSVSYSWLGVQTGEPDTSLAADLGIEQKDGAFIYSVYSNSPAAKAGLRPGDVVTRIGDSEIADSNALVRNVASLPVGKSTDFTVLRDGNSVELSVKTEKREENSGSDVSALWPGINIAPLTDDIRNQLSLKKKDEGIVIAAIAPDSIAGGSGLQQGDLVISINSEKVENARDFYRGLNAPSDEIQFRILRSGRELTIGFTKPEL